jgi:hypothetical protein
MAFLLNSENVFTYLTRAGLWNEHQRCDVLIAQPGKNFSIRVKGGDRDLLVKQEPHGPAGVAPGEILQEWWFYKLLEAFPELVDLRSRIIYPLHFDAENSVIVFPYLSDVSDLSDFYSSFCKGLAGGEQGNSGFNKNAEKRLPTAIAASLGENFAELHGSTFRKHACETFFVDKYSAYWSQRSKSGRSREELRTKAVPTPDFLGGLERLTPEAFCVIPTDALKFFRFYQRYPEIGEAIEGLNHSFARDCVVHNDPRFANFLLHDTQGFNAQFLDSQQGQCVEAKVQLIDWEKWTWGDPSYDLGRLIANYLQLWLKSLPVSANLDLATTLSRATVPLAAVQPSIEALIRAYIEKFPQILTHRPDFLTQLMRFTGLGLIRQVQIYISHKHPLGNVEMAMVQVAKSLLCQPEASIPTVFGQSKAAMESVVAAEYIQSVNR